MEITLSGALERYVDEQVKTGRYADANEVVHEAIRRAETTSRYRNLGEADADVMALAFIVMMEAAKSAQEDLKAIMDGVKLINKEKEGWRTVNDTIRVFLDPCADKTEDDKGSRARRDLREQLDSFSEIGEMESLRLQMAMDRLSKFMTTLSNLLKKISDTESSITQNIK
jgi:putative addiction module CopG family antidote